MNPTTHFLASALIASTAFACTTTVERETPKDKPVPTDPQEIAPICSLPDESLEFGIAVVAEAWPREAGDDFGPAPARDVVATCVTTSVERMGSDATIALSCSDELRTDEDVVVQLSNLPTDFEVPLAAELPIQLEYHWTDWGHHQRMTEWLAIHDEAGEQLLLSTIDMGGVSYVGDRIASLDLEVDDTVCAAPCEDIEFCSDGHRVAVVVDPAGSGERVTIVDGSRQSVVTTDGTYDVVVSAAQRFQCLNCSSNFSVLIGAQ